LQGLKSIFFFNRGSFQNERQLQGLKHYLSKKKFSLFTYLFYPQFSNFALEKKLHNAFSEVFLPWKQISKHIFRSFSQIWTRKTSKNVFRNFYQGQKWNIEVENICKGWRKNSSKQITPHGLSSPLWKKYS
jgi:hypothetical protein